MITKLLSVGSRWEKKVATRLKIRNFFFKKMKIVIHLFETNNYRKITKLRVQQELLLAKYNNMILAMPI